MTRFARLRRAALAALVAFAALAASAAYSSAADGASDEARLRGRMAPELAQQVLAIVREARDAGLPGDPLIGRALEGASRRVEPAGILADLRRHALALAAARDALGAGSTPGEIVAGAGALGANVPADTLARLRAAHPSGSLVISLVVLCDFVARGVPIETASSTVLTAARSGASDEALLRMRERVHDRIQRGGAPAGTTRDVLRQWLRNDVRAGPDARREPSQGGRSP